MSKIKLRPYQDSAVNEIRAEFARKNVPVLFVLATGGGKCLGRGTPVLMFDGTIKPVEDVVVGDLLMGPDSKPRRVMSLARGREMMYRVTPSNGEPYVVNESHILSLKRTRERSNPIFPSQRRAGEIVNISVRDYLEKSANWKRLHKGWRAGVDFKPSKKLPVPAYVLGAWLGDGTTGKLSFTTSDSEIAREFERYAKSIGMKFTIQQNSDWSVTVHMISASTPYGRRGSPFGNALRDLGIFRDKHIPHCYLTASRQDRLELLAGLMDTDGYYSGKGFDLILKSERLLDGAIYLARSLGFAAYKSRRMKKCCNNGVVGEYFSCTISGDVDQIPCRLQRKRANPRRQKKSVLVTGISVDAIGVDDYFGFAIDGDHLFLLGDFTVTHNTYTFSYIADSAASRGRRVLIIVHRKELLLQASNSLMNLGVPHGMISPHFTPDHNASVQVASIDTLMGRAARHPERYKFDLIIFDEAHHVVAGNKWGRAYEQLGRPAMLGVTATPVRSDGKGLGEHAGGLFKCMVLGPSIRDLIDMGMLINPEVYTCLELPDLTGVRKNKDGDYSTSELAERVDKPKITGSAVQHYKDICPGAQAVVFCTTVEHAKHVVAEFNLAGFKFALLVGAPHMSDAERTATNKALARGELHGVCTVDLVSEGYDLPALQCCIMLRPTMSESLFIQQAGRIMRPEKGKTRAVLLDHVGNVGATIDGEFVRKHGLPDEVREWTLDGREKKGRKAKEADPFKPVQCPKCWQVHVAAPTCPQCGHVYVIKGRGSIEQADGHLVQVTPEMAEKMKKNRKRLVGRARTPEELLQVEQVLGYRPGWARNVYISRGGIWPANVKLPEQPGQQ